MSDVDGARQAARRVEEGRRTEDQNDHLTIRTADHIGGSDVLLNEYPSAWLTITGCSNSFLLAGVKKLKEKKIERQSLRATVNDLGGAVSRC